MPTVTETNWGHWGAIPSTPAWVESRPKLHGETGGTLKQGYSDTVKWYYRRAKNPKDKAHCIKLLARYELAKEDHHRPSTAPVSSRKQQDFRKTTFQEPKPPCKSEAYQKQLNSIQRLSRPKSSRPASSKHYVQHRKTSFVTRPTSAMADIGRRRIEDPYLTTHESEFPGYATGLYAEATRPMSSKGFTAPYRISDPVGSTTCQNEFSWKSEKRVEPIRSGTSSGNRNNNPHPHESFMIWRLPNKSKEGMTTATADHLNYRELSDGVMDQILKDQLKSTYQNDYLGIPQGYQVKEAIDAPADWRSSIRRPLDTTVRLSYTKPHQQPELTGNVTRYGCNKNKGIAALGAVPTVTKDHVKNQEQIKGMTSYEKAYQNRYSKPDLLKLLNQQSNKKVIDNFLRYSRVLEKETANE
nr:testis-expressed protein 26 isoform X1 [Ciona intestinalis]XP_018670392.1 testis-expressed protein 26 isoform X2 [Ciona intestinalis]|eukprot:XP_002120589.1 testis-expressed protein 26 isoform X1 [Ciona intestinalis]